MAKGDYEMKGRLSRGSSLFAPDPQTQLLSALRQRDLRAFRRLLAGDAVDVDHCYEYPDYKTCLDLACSETGLSQFAKLLLEYNADVNKINETHKKAPVHFAAEAGDAETIKILLEDPTLEINSQNKGNSAILLAIKHVEDADDDREDIILKYEEIVECLLKAGIDVNMADLKGVTPIYSAAKQGLERIVELIIRFSANPLDLDTYKDRRQKTARMLIEQSFPHLLEKLPSKDSHKETFDINKLFYLISTHDEDKFVSVFNKLKKGEDVNKMLSENNGLYTLLQFACNAGLDKIVSLLLDNGAEPNLIAPGSMRSVALACTNGYYKILKLLVANESTSFEPLNGESLLQIVIKEDKKNLGDPNRDYLECFKILVDNPRTNPDINYLDVKENTALHYAARGGNQETVMALLQNGACIGLRNRFNEPPLADMSARTLEAFLDGCLTTNNERPNAEDYEIQYNYNFLVPPTNAPDSECKVPLMDDSNVTISSNDRFLAPETDALLYMTHHSELRPLLKHPVITSFLFMKWQRISCLFYTNITFYTLFWLSLILYILLGYGGPQEKTDLAVLVAKITQILTIFGLLMLIMRELLQIVVSPRVYLKSIENWLEIGLIVVTSIIMFNISEDEKFKQQLSAIAILLSSAELVLLIGQFPTLSTNIVMLKTVSWNFFKFLLWYCILIIAFSLSFYTLFRGQEEPKPNPDDGSVEFNPNKAMEASKEDEDTDFFLDPGISLFKTIVMLTGELDAGSINFEAFPVTSHIIFVIFVFMIPIVLFNLLNGLAVSDTQAIKANAELVGHISRIQLISYFESVLLGDLVPYKNAVSSMQNACCWLPGKVCIKPRLICIKPLARRICLFPNFLPMAQIGVKPNQNLRVVIFTSDHMKKKQENNSDNPDLTLCCLRSCNQLQMDRKIVKASKILIHEREEGETNDLKKIQEQLTQYEKKIENFEKILEKIYISVKDK